MTTQTLDRHIEKTPQVLGGKPRVAGRRIAVEHIVIWHEWMGKSADEIATDYDLSLAEIYAALAYYYDNPREINQSVEDTQALVEEMKKAIPSKLPFPLKTLDA